VARQLTVVVTCTERKSAGAAPELLVRNLATGDVSARFEEWAGRLSRATSSRPLDQLYNGEAWSQVASLVRTARRAGYRPRLLVASAGLGLRPIESNAPPYGATFTSGHPDAVGQTLPERRCWWMRLAGLADAQAMSTIRERVLLVLSHAYATAMDEDLIALGHRGLNALVIGGARNIEGLPRVAADKALRSVLGGTATSLNLRTAQAWMERHDGGPRLFSTKTRLGWDQWAVRVRVPERYERIPMTDRQVVDFVKAALRRRPTLSRTQALRLLRDQSRACEQSRFAALYAKAVSE